MPTRKQRRRQQKLRRHEYEEVYVDEEGNLVEPDEAVEDAPSPPGRSNGGRAKAERRTPATGRGARAMQPPSWRRVLKRGAIFAPIMFILVTLLAGDELTVEQRLLQTLFLLLVFLPFSYLMDTVTYRIWRRRTGAG